MRKFRVLLPLLAMLSFSGCDEDNIDTIDIQPVQPTASIVVDPMIVLLYENGDMQKVVVRLSMAPAVDVTVTATPSDLSEFIVVNGTATLNSSNWNSGFAFYLSPIEDNTVDGTQIVTLTLTTTSVDPAWQLAPFNIQVTVLDSGMAQLDCSKTPDDPACPQPLDCSKTPDDPACPQALDCSKTPDDPACPQLDGIKLRFMAANTTSGNGQNYDDGKGIRMFQAMKPDIVMIQEFNYNNNKAEDIRQLVDTAFGTEYSYYRGNGSIPNGIVSRFPILSSGTWDSQHTPDRDPEWAIVDIPGDKDLLVVSVHLSTKNNGSEIGPLQEQIKNKINFRKLSDGTYGGDYYVVLGGDFNTRSRGGVRSTLCSSSAVFSMGKDAPSNDVCNGGDVPVDQNNNSCTSAERDDPYDWVLFDKVLNSYEVPVVIGSHSYKYGHILDSRVYDEYGELNDIAPVRAEDSWKCTSSPMCSSSKEPLNNFQHMPVIRDIVLPK